MFKSDKLGVVFFFHFIIRRSDLHNENVLCTKHVLGGTEF